jgi:hypothetical protein
LARIKPWLYSKIKLYNDQRNAQVFNYLSIYFCLTCLGLSFSPTSEAGVQIWQWFKFPGYGVSAWALTPYVGHYTISFQNARSLKHKVK